MENETENLFAKSRKDRKPNAYKHEQKNPVWRKVLKRLIEMGVPSEMAKAAARVSVAPRNEKKNKPKLPIEATV